MPIELDRDSERPLGEQVADGLAALIERGEWLAGSRLPSVRQLAQRLGVSAFTVLAGYDRLIARQLVVSRPGAGYFVVTPQAPLVRNDAPFVHADPADAVGFAMQALDGEGVAVRSGTGYLPESWLEEAIPAALVARVAKDRAALFRSTPPQGRPGLRERLASRLQGLGIAASAAHVVTTIGASHAADLVLRALLRPGDCVVVEDPGYLFFAAQVRALDLNLVAVPRRSDGPDLAALEEAAQRHHPKLFITQTLLHNPTGGSTSPAHAHRVLMLAERYGFQILEDDVYGDLAPRGATRLAQLGGLRRVFYAGSFSKMLSPALRVGYLALPAAALDAVLGQKVLNQLASPGFPEAVLEAVLDAGRFPRHTQQLRTRLAQFRTGALALLSGAGLQFDDAAAQDGLFLWGRLPGLVDADGFVRGALAQGVLLAMGRMFSPSGGCGEYLRFSVAHSCDPRLAQVLMQARPSNANVLPLRRPG